MNRFRGHITAIETDGAMSLVTVETDGQLSLNCILIDTPDSAPYLVLGREVQVLFKETEVVIGLEQTTGISMRNRIACKVLEVKQGKLLTSLELMCAGGKMYSIISTRSAEELEIAPGKSVLAMIKLNELMLSPI